MSTIHFHETTTSTPEQFLAGLTDFGPGRSKLFGKQRRRLPQGASPWQGRVLGLVLVTIGKRVLEKAFENTVKAIEARNHT